jgi:hypothetical protein
MFKYSIFIDTYKTQDLYEAVTWHALLDLGAALHSVESPQFMVPALQPKICTILSIPQSQSQSPLLDHLTWGFSLTEKVRLWEDSASI